MTQTLRLTAADYPRLMPLVTGEVQIEGCELELLLGQRGGWPARAEMLRRALQDSSVHGGEASMGVHLRRVDAGDRAFVALPVFVLRNFTARDLYVRQGSELREASELKGKRIGMYSWSASGSIWYRHFLRWCGVEADAAQWVIGDPDKAWGGRSEAALPPYVRMAPEGRSLSSMLLDGELDAIYSPPRPAQYDPAKGPIARLYPDPRPIEARYYRETGVFPPQHLIVLRRDVWEADHSLARRVTDAFVAAEEAFDAAVHSLPYLSPWFEQDLEASRAELGANPYAHGLEGNRDTMEQFLEQGHRLGLTKRRVSIDEYFAEYLAG